MSTDAASRGPGDDAISFGELLRAWRRRALLTQEQLAERSRLDVRTIRRFERGLGGRTPRSPSLRRLVAALDLDAAERALLVEAACGALISARCAQSGAAARSMEPGPSVEVNSALRQLPPAPPRFTGRATDLAALEDVREKAGAVIVAIDGMPGVGKTALAVHAAHRWSTQYPDGQIFLDLQGYTRGAAPVEPGDALNRLLRSLGVPRAQIPDDLDDRAALYRSHLAERRLLVLLDNAASEAQVGPLLPGAGGCLIVITSRRPLVGLDLTHTHSLDLLPSEDAVTLFARTSGALAEQPERLIEVVELCGRLPLAIRIAGARLRTRPTWTVAHLVDRLRTTQNRLAELEIGDCSVAAALELSYVQLDPDLRSTYRMLGLHPGQDLDLEAAAALTGQSAVQVRRKLDHLLDAHMLHEPIPGRYRLHYLTWAHAATIATKEVAEPERRAALRRLADHHRRAAHSAVESVYLYRREDWRGAASTTAEDPPPGIS